MLEGGFRCSCKLCKLVMTVFNSEVSIATSMSCILNILPIFVRMSNTVVIVFDAAKLD